jgi:hypothetical protein
MKITFSLKNPSLVFAQGLLGRRTLTCELVDAVDVDHNSRTLALCKSGDPAVKTTDKNHVEVVLTYDEIRELARSLPEHRGA